MIYHNTYKILRYVNFEDVTNPGFIFENHQPFQSFIDCVAKCLCLSCDMAKYFEQRSIKTLSTFGV